LLFSIEVQNTTTAELLWKFSDRLIILQNLRLNIDLRYTKSNTKQDDNNLMASILPPFIKNY
jgi:hypothetical protein